MSDKLPVTGDFNPGPKLPYKLSLLLHRILHHKWRFYFLAGAVLIIGGLAFLGLKMPWKSDQVSERPESAEVLELNPIATNDTSQAGSNEPGAKTNDEDKQTADEADSSRNQGGNSGGDSSGNGSGSDGSGGDSGDGNGSGGDNSGGSRCPAYPAFPDANCTGVLPGTTLTNCSGSINQPNQTFTNCLFASGISLGDNATGVTIKNSRIMGVVHRAGSFSGMFNITLEDVEINSQNNDTFGAISLRGYTCRRCHVHNARVPFGGNNFTVEDSYAHDIFGSAESHNEAILLGRGNATIRHNRLIANFNSATTGGGMSATIAMYTHGTFWPALDNVLIEKNYITTSDAYYCMYGGHSSDTDGDPSNIRVIDNVFGPCGISAPYRAAIVGWLRGNGNVWSGNRWQDGTSISEPNTTEYN